MAGEYDLNLSNGNVFATLYPLETNGPDNVSTPRLIQQARPSYGIVLAVPGGPSFSIVGDFTNVFRTGFIFEVVGSTSNDGSYTVASSSFGGGNTSIIVTVAPTDSVADGSIIAHIFRLAGDVTSRFVSAFAFNVQESSGPLITSLINAGTPTSPDSFVVSGDYTFYFLAAVTFDVVGSTGNDGTYTVTSSSFASGETTIVVVEPIPDATVDGKIDGLINGAYTVTAEGPIVDGTTTIIPVTNGSIRDQVINPMGLPLGEIIYTHLDTVSSLRLPGKGTTNYGERITENLLRLAENFAADNPPETNTIIGTSPAATPLVGQLWYNTTGGSEGLNVWDGAAWNPLPSTSTTATLIAGISWREPVRVRDEIVYANSAAFPTGGVIDSVTLVDGDRVLFSKTTLATDRDIFIWDAGGSWSKEAANPQSVGDVTYIQEGSGSTLVVALSDTDDWNLIGGGSGVNITYEVQTAGAAQTIFNLASIKYSIGTNRLRVFVDGVKSIITTDYTETDPDTVTFGAGLTGGELVEFYAYEEQSLNAVSKREQQTGLIGTPVISFLAIVYQLGGDNLLVFVNGQKMIKDIDYTETTDSSITWIGTALVATDVLEFYVSVPITAGTLLRDINDVSAATPNNLDTLVYDSGNGLWTAQSASAGGVNFDYVTGATGKIMATVHVNTTGKTATTAYQQVFLNGVLQREDVIGLPTGNYYVSGAKQITFDVALVASDEVLVYQLVF